MISDFLTETPYGTALYVCIGIAAFCWVMSLVTRECSWVDRVWSLAPPIYCLIVAIDSGFQSARVTIMTVLVLIWSVRLTANFALKGGYWVGGEDYRWAHLREQLSPLQFQLVNVTFVSPGQMAIIWLFASPIHQAWVHSEQPLGWLDYLAIVLFLVFLVLESVADAQMWRFQQDKKRQISAGLEVPQPFMAKGLFSISRHPNYLGEMAIWVTFYLFAISASGRVWHWTGLGWVLLILLFQPSARLTETISSEKYPTYSSYQAAVPMFIPNPFRTKRGEQSHTANR